jgi:hypothetical protein
MSSKTKSNGVAAAPRVMTTTIEDGTLVIRIPIDGVHLSASGKSKVIATTHGNARTEAQYDGKPVTVGVNAYVSAK